MRFTNVDGAAENGCNVRQNHRSFRNFGSHWTYGPKERPLYRDCYVGCLKGISKSLQVPFHGMEAVLVLTLIILKLRALQQQPSKLGSRLVLVDLFGGKETDPKYLRSQERSFLNGP